MTSMTCIRKANTHLSLSWGVYSSFGGLKVDSSCDLRPGQVGRAPWRPCRGWWGWTGCLCWWTSARACWWRCLWGRCRSRQRTGRPWWCSSARTEGGCRRFLRPRTAAGKTPSSEPPLKFGFLIIKQVTSYPGMSHVCFYWSWWPFDPALCVCIQIRTGWHQFHELALQGKREDRTTSLPLPAWSHLALPRACELFNQPLRPARGGGGKGESYPVVFPRKTWR